MYNQTTSGDFFCLAGKDRVEARMLMTWNTPGMREAFYQKGERLSRMLSTHRKKAACLRHR